MQTRPLQIWIARRIAIRQRLERICTSYLLFLMVVTQKHSLEEAARFSGRHKSHFCKMLQAHSPVAISTLERLSKKPAKQFAKSLRALKGLPWKIAIIIDRTLQHRASLHPDNAKKVNHGKGYVIGHQWTNSVVILTDVLMPLRPIPSYSQRYCREHKLAYQTEHERVVDSLNTRMLEDYIGAYDPRDVLVLADSGYDDKKIENAIVNKRWHFIIALGKTRRVKSATLSLTPPKSRQWCHIAPCLRNHRRLPWTTIRLMTSGAKRQRMECRIRHTMGSLRYVGKGHWVCSECRKRPEGRRKYLACNDGNATARQIMLGYRLRWAVELFHKAVKMHLGFEDGATSGFDSVQSPVHWVYCAYILLRRSPPGVPPDVQAVGDKQRHLQQCLANKGKRYILQKLSQIGGVERYKDALRQALTDT
jgi:Transposase DDE domain